MKRLYYSCIVAILGLIAGCTVGPKYQKPPAPVPPTWGWKIAEPSNDSIQSDWWKSFHDPVLDNLEQQAATNNQRLQVAMARVDQSRAAARVTGSRFFPQVSFDPSLSTFHTQKNHVPSELSATAGSLVMDFSYEVDLWGKIRRAFEAARDQSQATEADYCGVLLTLQGDVAVNYFLLRQIDAQIELLQETVGLRENSVRVIKERFKGGLAPELDLDRATTELEQTKTQVRDAQRQRDHLQDAIALLCGEPAESFHISSGPLNQALPTVPIGLPSKLLERRPDIAVAERQMAAANAQIGVAKAAYFPAITLTGDAGYSSFHAATLLDWQSRLFQIGPSVAMPLLNGGRLKAGVAEARANYEGSRANYQQQVLSAFKDVSDALADLNSYGDQAATEANAGAAADRAAALSTQRYKGGLVNYLDVLDAERTQVQTQIQIIQIRALRMVATVHLFKALGGGFSTVEIQPSSVQKNTVEQSAALH